MFLLKFHNLWSPPNSQLQIIYSAFSLKPCMCSFIHIQWLNCIGHSMVWTVLHDFLVCNSVIREQCNVLRVLDLESERPESES